LKAPKPAIAAARVPVDGDRDGVMDEFDQCLSSAPGASVDSAGCELFSGQINMVFFDHDSDNLTSKARSILSSVASQMASQPNATLNLEGYADLMLILSVKVHLHRITTLPVDVLLIVA